ncbi:MAG: RtcB family protein [Anaerolineales bacterium]|nr:MAG: RtcB family protein [Anaerolineales bacterium]
MVDKKDMKRITDYLYEIPKEYREDMRVPARIYADEKLLEATLRDRSLEQLVNTATLPGIVGYALAMPDIHQGYGFTIGGVAATRYPSGIISPGGVGYDINCGVRLLISSIEADEVKPHISTLISALYRNVPSGVGKKGSIKLSSRQMDQVLEKGAAWAVKQGYGSREDLERIEERGAMAGAEARAVSSRAKERGKNQLGTLGSGNHFLEIEEVVEVYDEEVADTFGLFPGQLAVQVHSGSRGLGHQVCTDYVRSLQEVVRKYHIELPDRQLVCAPLDSPEGRDYFAAMAGAANYAWANRQCLAHLARRTFEEILAGKVRNWELTTVYDVAHNIAKIEEYEVDGRRTKLCVHRKGATRAFGPGRPELPEIYRAVGQPVLVPGDMGTASYVLVGTKEAMRTSFGSTCHGAGRVLSRKAAKKRIRGDKLKAELEAQGIQVRAKSMPGLAEEAPAAYKDIEHVVDVVHRAGLARKVAKLRPLAVMKG